MVARHICSWQKGPNCTYFMKIPPILCTPPFSNIVQAPLSCHLQPPSLTAFYVVLFLWLNEWLHHIWCSILLNDIMDLHMSSLGTLVLEGPWCVFYGKRHQVWHITLFSAGTLIWSRRNMHTLTNTHSTLRGQ